MRIRLLKNAFIVITAVALLVIPLGTASANLIPLSFSFADTNGAGTVTGDIFGLDSTLNTEQAAVGLTVTSSPFADSVGAYTPTTINSFLFDNGTLTLIDFVSTLFGGNAGVFRLDFLGPADTPGGNRINFTGLQFSINSPTFPNATFTSARPSTPVPSPGPLALMFAGLLGLAVSRKSVK